METIRKSIKQLDEMDEINLESIALIRDILREIKVFMEFQMIMDNIFLDKIEALEDAKSE